MNDHTHTDPTPEGLSPEEQALIERLDALGARARSEPDAGFEDRLAASVLAGEPPMVETRPITASRRFWTRPALLLAPAMAASFALVVWFTVPTGQTAPDNRFAMNDAPSTFKEETAILDDRADEIAAAKDYAMLTAPTNVASGQQEARAGYDYAYDRNALADTGAAYAAAEIAGAEADDTADYSYEDYQSFEAELALIEADLVDIELGEAGLGSDWSM